MPYNTQRIDASSGRKYWWRGESFDSVTSIIGSGVPKPALIGWAAKFTAEYAVAHFKELTALMEGGDTVAAIEWLKNARLRKTSAAADLGSLIHKAIEQYILGGDIDATGPGAAYLNGFKMFLEDFSPEFVTTEAKVYHRELGYAGQFDSILDAKRKRYLVDWKTGSGIYPEVALQLKGYENAEFIGTEDDQEVPMFEVDRCAALHLVPNNYEFVEVRHDEEVWEGFLGALAVAHFQTSTAKFALGTRTKRGLAPKGMVR